MRITRDVYTCRGCGVVIRDYAEYRALGIPAPKGQPPKFCNDKLCEQQFKEDLEAWAEINGPSIRGFADSIK